MCHENLAPLFLKNLFGLHSEIVFLMGIEAFKIKVDMKSV